MFGIQPVGMQDKRRLVLPDDWPAELHPLRKDAMDYRFRPTPTTEEETYEFIDVEGDGLLEMPLGPLHMTSDEPGHFRLYMDGEHIVDADYRLFYVHRGMEKLAEITDELRPGDVPHRPHLRDLRLRPQRGIQQFGGTGAGHRGAGRVRNTSARSCWRWSACTVTCLNLGLACHFVGFDTGFMQFFRVREKTMKMAELLTGARKTYGMNLIGGIRRDILKEERTQTLQWINELRVRGEGPG